MSWETFAKTTLTLALLAHVCPVRAAAAGALPPSPAAVARGQVVAMPPSEELPDTADLVPWPEAAYLRCASNSVGDARGWLLDAPAGKHGWVKARPDGRVEFADGTPARFWGTTLTYAGSFPDKPEEVDAIADALAACGYNLVRFHHNDIPRVGLGYLREKTDTAPSSAIELDPVGMERLDRIAVACFKRGIYIHLDLVDSRPWAADTGMADWEALSKIGSHAGWKGVWPHPDMIAAWKRAATALLSHVNPYTGRTWGEEPGIVVIEALNENGPFWDWGFTVTDSVRQWHVADWNRWLVKRYGTRDALAKRWTDGNGVSGLHPDEDPAAGTVHRPALTPVQEWDRGNGSKARGPCRLNDFYTYLAENTIALHQQTSAHIRSHGFKGLVIGSHELQGPINQLAEVQATGMIAAHLYTNARLAWGARPGVSGITLEGVDVKSNNWYVNLPRIKVAGAPSWNGEWTGGSFTRRADVNLGVATAHAFQRVDGGAQFGFIQRWVGEPMPNFDWTYRYRAWRKGIHQAYATGHDPTWTIPNRIAAAMILRGDLPRSRYKAHIALSAEDVHEQNLHAAGINGGSGTVGGASLFLPLLHEVETAFFETAYEGDADVVFSTGHSASGDYRKARHAMILGDNPWCDRYRQKRDLAAPARLLHPGLEVGDLKTSTVFTVTWPYAAPRAVELPRTEAAIAVASLPAGATPIGLSADGLWTLGWCDKRFLVLPNAAAYGERVADARWLYRLYLAAAAHWGIDLGDNSADSAEYRSDTGCLVTDWATGSQLVDSPRSQIIAGFIGYRQANTTANLAVQIATAYGAIALTSTDNAPIASAKRMLLVAAGRTANTGMELGPGKDDKIELLKTGGKPTLVEALRGTVQLRNLAAGKRQVFALDSQGRRLGEVPTTQEADTLSFVLSPRWRTIWFEVCAPETAGPPAPEGTVWPGDEPAPSEAPAAVATLSLSNYLAKVSAPPVSVEEPVPALSPDGFGRMELTDMANWKSYQGYNNLKASVGKRERTPILDLSIGQHTKDWSAGTWFNVASAGGLKAEDAVAISFGFQGDGTLPRTTTVTLKTRDGTAWASRNLNQHFEDTTWHEVVLRPGDFSAKAGGVPDLATITRIDFSCVGPLMDTRHTARLGAFTLLTRGDAEAKIEKLGGALPPVAVLAAPELVIPVVDAAIHADGDPSESAWAKAVGFSMDEGSVPAWHKIGSFIAEGSRKQGEKASFWLLATPAGLALVADVEKGAGAPINNKDKWYLGDCVEVFTDVALARKGPSKQIFLAYRRPGLDRGTSTAPGASVGRVRTARGYALEALIPWPDLGFTAMPTGPFGIDLQVDVGDADGRRLLLSFGTGTNEGWITAARYLKVSLAQDNERD